MALVIGGIGRLQQSDAEKSPIGYGSLGRLVPIPLRFLFGATLAYYILNTHNLAGRSTGHHYIRFSMHEEYHFNTLEDILFCAAFGAFTAVAWNWGRRR